MIAEQMGHDYATMSTTWLWLLANWQAQQGAAARLEPIAAAHGIKRDSSGLRRDSLLEAAVSARLLLARGIPIKRCFGSERSALMRPHATCSGSHGSRWGSSGSSSRKCCWPGGDMRGLPGRRAVRIAWPLVFLIYLRPSLAIRIRAAVGMGDIDRAARDRARLKRMEQSSPSRLPGPLPIPEEVHCEHCNAARVRHYHGRAFTRGCQDAQCLGARMGDLGG